MRTFEKFVLFCGHMARIACDGQCRKAWGMCARPRARLSGDEDDYAYLADDELGDAPDRSDTTEGGDNKPTRARCADDMNRWCARQCERRAMTEIGRPLEPLDLPDFSRRIFNIRRRGAADGGGQ